MKTLLVRLALVISLCSPSAGCGADLRDAEVVNFAIHERSDTENEIELFVGAFEGSDIASMEATLDAQEPHSIYAPGVYFEGVALGGPVIVTNHDWAAQWEDVDLSADASFTIRDPSGEFEVKLNRPIEIVPDGTTVGADQQALVFQVLGDAGTCDVLVNSIGVDVSVDGDQVVVPVPEELKEDDQLFVEFDCGDLYSLAFDDDFNGTPCDGVAKCRSLWSVERLFAFDRVQ